MTSTVRDDNVSRVMWKHQEMKRVSHFWCFRVELDQYGSDTWHYMEVTGGSMDVDVAVHMLMWHCTDDNMALY
jgi:hypothetical protein